MLFRPSFCCNCGEKIERAEWKLWTSRRFCELCATDFSLQEYAVKAAIVLASVIALFGFVRLFAGSKQPELAARRAVEKPQNTVAERNPANPTAAPSPSPQMPAANSIEDRSPRTLVAMPPPNTAGKAPVDPSDDVYICGAATKKGTPCSRKVKGPVRCWQHIGQPAILPVAQLKVSR